MDKKFIIKLQWKEFVKFEWLLAEFHKNWGKEIKTQVINYEPFIVQATVTWERWTYQWMWDSDENNTGKMVLAHKIRMSETRAIARALRRYNNIGMCSVDELWWPEEKKPQTKPPFTWTAKTALVESIQSWKLEVYDKKHVWNIVRKKYAITEDVLTKLDDMLLKAELYSLKETND